MTSEKKITPMLKQYFEIKEKHPNAFLFFRLGDFYEMFGEDAKEAAKILGLTLTARGKGGPNEIAMCGVPHHSSEKYIAQLTQRGKRVALCEQVSDPSLPGIVQRDVVKIITPGTTMDETVTDTKKNNYLLSLIQEKEVYGVSFLDLATGEFQAAEFQNISELKNLMLLLDPSEVLVKNADEWKPFDREFFEYELPYFEEADTFLKKHFEVDSLSGFGVEKLPLGIQAAASVLHYAKESQKADLDHIKNIKAYRFQDLMILDESTIRNLEILHTSKDLKKEGSLIHTIDKTLTRMGARKMRHTLLGPLQDKEKIEKRLEVVSEFFDQESLRSDLQNELKDFYDIERLVGRIGCRSVNARDLNYLKANILKIPILKSSLNTSKSGLLSRLRDGLSELRELVQILEEKISPEAPVTITEGGMMAEGFHTELDELRAILFSGKDWMMNYQQKLRDETGISNLKVKFNKVFGYHIEVSKGQVSKVPESFDLKQTLVNAQRYVTEELSSFAEKHLTAEERIKTLEYELFQETVEELIPFLQDIQKNADIVAQLDVLQSFGQLAKEEQYCRPEMSHNGGIQINEGRHPVIEKMLKKQHEVFISNSVSLDPEKQIHVLTGPNMAGKSSYLRQVALIVLLAHIGSFVPAQSAKIQVTDRIFTRVGASDDISTGQSTFMVEMTEAANILNNATEKSLIIFDELGRGTSTYDGVSIAWSVLEYLAKKVKALTLFATHYHELIEVAKEIPNAHNASMSVAEKNGRVVFLRKVIEGGVDKSYGIEVARRAGLPAEVIERAGVILSELEKDRLMEESVLMGLQPSLFSQPKNIVESEPSPQRKVLDKIKEMNINEMTPVEALQELNAIQKMMESKKASD